MQVEAPIETALLESQIRIGHCGIGSEVFLVQHLTPPSFAYSGIYLAEIQRRREAQVKNAIRNI